MKTKTKVWLITAAFLVLIGCIIFVGAMSTLNWDFTKLSTAKYESNTYEISENYKNISIITDTADIVLIPSKSPTTSVSCYEYKNENHSVTVKDGTLVIEVLDTRKWYEHININFGSPKITVSMPQEQYNTLFVKSSTGDILIESISAGDINLSVSTGKVTVSRVNCEGDVTVGVSTGKTYLTDIKCKNVISSASTGNISLDNVSADEKFSIESSTGNVIFNRSDAAEIYINTDTGDVTGNLLTDKVFIVQTDTGKVDVPKTITGGRCEINTDTGNIVINICQ